MAELSIAAPAASATSIALPSDVRDSSSLQVPSESRSLDSWRHNRRNCDRRGQWGTAGASSLLASKLQASAPVHPDDRSIINVGTAVVVVSNGFVTRSCHRRPWRTCRSCWRPRRCWNCPRRTLRRRRRLARTIGVNIVHTVQVNRVVAEAVVGIGEVTKVAASGSVQPADSSLSQTPSRSASFRQLPSQST